MKKSNAQAERHSNRAGALRGSRPRTDIFFYLFLDYKHKHTVNQMELCVVHLPTPTILNRLQAQAPSTTELTHSMCEIFFYFFYFLDYKHRHAPVQGSSTTQQKPGPL